MDEPKIRVNRLRKKVLIWGIFGIVVMNMME